MWVTAGPTVGAAGNTVQNNVFAYGRNGGFALDTPWPQGCATTLRAAVESNVFYFDRNESSAVDHFAPVEGCAYSCGLPFDQFEEFTRNLYWGTGAAAGFATDEHQFHVDLETTPATATACSTSAGGMTYMSFGQWQSTLPTDAGLVVMDEDTAGVIADPGFSNPKYPADDYRLTASPVAGFDQSQTNDTVENAGRTTTTLTAPDVPRTFPTYTFNPATGF